MNIQRLTSSSNQNIATAWLLSTLGTSSGCKKVPKKDILCTSIKDTCNLVRSSAIPLRFSSNLMYGVTLIYRQKVEYFYGDVSLLLSRLQRDIFFKKYGEADHRITTNAAKITGNALVVVPKITYLVEDPLFDVGIDFVAPFYDNYELSITKHFSSCGSVASTLLHPQSPYQSPNQSMYGDLDLDLDNNHKIERSRVLDDTTIDFEFDINGLLVEDTTQNSPEHSSTLEEVELGEEILEEAINNLLAPELDTRKRRRSTSWASLPQKRLIVDRRGLTISIQQNPPVISTGRVSERSSPDQTSLELLKLVALESRDQKMSPFLNFCYLHIFGGRPLDVNSLEFKRHTPLTCRDLENSIRLSDEIEVSRRMGLTTEEMEVSRRQAVYGGEDPQEFGDQEFLIRLEHATTTYTADTSNLTFDQSLDISFPMDGSEWEHSDAQSRSQAPETTASNAEIVEKFFDYVKSRTGLIQQEHRQGNGNLQPCEISFADLVPTESVSKKVAAASFSSLLVLATHSKITLINPATAGEHQEFPGIGIKING